MHNEEPDAESSTQGMPPSSGYGWVKFVGLAIVVVGLFAAFSFLPVGEYLGRFLKFAQGLGVWGLILLAVVYVVATVFMLPGSVLTLGAGFTFGLVEGTLAVMAGSVLGALAAFLVGRYFARDFVEAKAREYPRFAALDSAVEREGFKIVLLTRLSPVFPFNLLNYLFSITKVRTRDYLLGSWLGMIPGTIMYVYIGWAAKDLAKIAAGDVEKGPLQYVYLGVGLVITIAVTIYITRIARKALREYVPEKPEGND